MPTHAPKLEAELSRYQKVLDAYHAFPGDLPEPSGALDQNILARAQSAVAPKTVATPRLQRRWPMAIAASVATIGFAAILARHSLREPAPSYEDTPAMRQVQSAPQSEAVDSTNTDTLAKEERSETSLGQIADSTMDDGASRSDQNTQSEPIAASAAPVLMEAAPSQPIAPAAPPPPAEPSADTAAAKAVSAPKPVDAAAMRARQSSEQELAEEAEVAAAPAALERPQTRQAAAEPVATHLPAPIPAPAATMARPAPASIPTERLEAKAIAEPEAGVAEPMSQATGGAPATEQDAAQDGSLHDEKPDAASSEQGRSAKRGVLGILAANPIDALFKQIRQLRADGELEKARELLIEFRKKHPEHEIPEDLRDLLEH